MALVGLGLKEDVEDDGGAAHVGDTVCRNVPVHVGCGGVPEAHVGAAVGGDAPCEGPPIAVEHRQRPEVHRLTPHFPPEDQAEVLRSAPRWLYTTPLGSDVVPVV
ncbi:hypothetical protein NL676_028202 [Syzygium grande]|nr:hypothetical protein NL676_028202 [Syzygium grande]